VIAAYVGGVGLCAPGFAHLGAWLGAADPAVWASRPEVLPAPLRRRASPLSTMVADVAGRAAAQAGASLSTLPLVLGSAYGELGIAVQILAELHQGEGLPSPTRFHNSVHNAPAGYLSIAAGNRGFSTALAAGWETPAASLLEALALLSTRGGEVLVVLADEPPPAPFAPAHPYLPAAAALHLSAEPGPRTRARLQRLRREEAGLPRVPVELAGHPCAGALALAAAVALGTRGAVPLGPAGAHGWVVDLDAAAGP